MKAKELREKEVDVLRQDLGDAQRHLFTLRSQAVTEKLEDPSQIKRTRREIARIKTVLRERELAAAASSAAQQQQK